MEISRLRAELARVKMERDILGKATGYFAKLRHEVAYVIVSPAHKVGDETGCSVSVAYPCTRRWQRSGVKPCGQRIGPSGPVVFREEAASPASIRADEMPG